MNRPPDPQFIAFVQKRDEKFSTKACCLKRKKELYLLCNRYLWYVFSRLELLAPLKPYRYPNCAAPAACKSASELEELILSELPNASPIAVNEPLRIVKAAFCDLIGKDDGADIEYVPLRPCRKGEKAVFFVYSEQVKKALMLCFYGFDTEYEQTLPETSKEKRLSNALDRKLDAGEWIVVRPQYTYLSASPPPPENYLPFFKDQSVFYTLAGLMSAPVTDKNYGKGIITACDESTVTAVFESVGEKVLPFPDAFEESTAFVSAELNAMMWYYLARTRSQRLINERHENDRLRYDPIEKTRYFTYANPYAAQLAEESIGLPSDWFINFGEGFTLELAKESILKERFGIIWRTVTDMNPDVCFD